VPKFIPLIGCVPLVAGARMHSANMELYYYASMSFKYCTNCNHVDCLIHCISIVVRSARFCKVTSIKINTCIPLYVLSNFILFMALNREGLLKNQGDHIVFRLSFDNVMMYHEVH